MKLDFTKDNSIKGCEIELTIKNLDSGEITTIRPTALAGAAILKDEGDNASACLSQFVCGGFSILDKIKTVESLEDIVNGLKRSVVLGSFEDTRNLHRVLEKLLEEDNENEFA